VLDLSLAQASDLDIWRYATAHQMIIVSKDEDFLHLATRPGAEAQLIWVRFGNCRTPHLLAAVDRVWDRVQACLEAGDRVVEVR
jgi:predicted nuclease of predicted toxin-antitoxin system